MYTFKYNLAWNNSNKNKQKEMIWNNIDELEGIIYVKGNKPGRDIHTRVSLLCGV